MKKLSEAVVVVLFDALATVILLEIALLVFMPAPVFKHISITGVNQPGFEGQYRLSSNPLLIYVPMPNTGVFNSQGFRGKEAGTAKKEGTTRCLFLGDSVAYGIDVPYEKCFTTLLGQKLGGNYEIMNLAVPGYNILQEVEYLKEFGIQFHPDRVFFGITSNDLDLNSAEVVRLNEQLKQKDRDFYRRYYSLNNRIHKGLLFSNVYRYYVYYSSKRRDTESGGGDGPAGIGGYQIDEVRLEALMRSLQKMSDRHRFRVTFLLLPVNNDPACLETIRAAAARKGFEAVDFNGRVNRAFGQAQKNSLFLREWDPYHFSESGHEVLAQLIFQNVFDLAK